MTKYYLAIDIGASSGRHILGWYENEKLFTEEVYRFPNGMIKKNGSLVWDTEALYGHILSGLAACKDAGKLPCCLGIDTWGVDFVLLDENNQRIGEAVGYRDARTDGMDACVREIISDEALYTATGIQKQPFNTIYQLMALKKNHPEQLAKAKTFLMIPEYLSFLLTGNMAAEYTNATTTQLVNAETKDWDRNLIRRLGYPDEMFLPVRMPCSLGSLRSEIASKLGFSCEVFLPATHDTGSAVLAVPTESDDDAYISSGTWSLVGMERMTPDTSENSRRLNFTNEGGYAGRFRYLKNVTGLWIIQSMKKELKAQGQDYTFDELCGMAMQFESTPLRVDVNSPVFLAPDSMIRAVETACGKASMEIGELFSVVYHSLAESYRSCIRELEEVTGKSVSVIRVVGGGSRDSYLNRLTSEACGKDVYAGPSEATAIGNLIAQMLGSGVFGTVQQARKAISDSFEIHKEGN